MYRDGSFGPSQWKDGPGMSDAATMEEKATPSNLSATIGDVVRVMCPAFNANALRLQTVLPLHPMIHTNVEAAQT
jgi:hypothetical protein